MYFVSKLVTSALSIIRRMAVGPVPDREAGVMQIISRLLRLRQTEKNMVSGIYFKDFFFSMIDS